VTVADLRPRRSGTSARPSTSGRARSHLALAALSLVLFLTFLDNTIVSVVLANVQSALHAGVGGLQWIVNGYALTFAGLMLSFGALSDVWGRKRVMLTGVAVFCAGSVVCALAPDVATLVAGRVVMGVGAAASEPGTLSMIRQLYRHREERARALGVWVAISSLALALGPVIGGLLAGVWSWRAIFWFNLFFGAAALLLASGTLPESADPSTRRFDAPGAVLAAGALVAASFAVIAGETAGYRTAWIIALFVVAAMAAVAFVLRERAVAEPVLDVRFFERAPFAGSNVVAFATYFGVFAVFFFVALYLQVVGSHSLYQTALDFVPMAAGMVVASALTGRWVARAGPRTPMWAGCLAAGVGLLVTDVVLTPTSTVATLGWPLALAGVGFGVVLVPVTAAAMSSIPSEHSGMAASMTNTSRELGAVAGVAVLGSVVNGQLTTNLVHRLAAIGIPAQFRAEVVTAVTTGTVSGQASAASKNPAIAAIVHRVVHAAYAAFSHGLDLSLTIAASFMIAGAVIAAFTLEPRRARAMSGWHDLPAAAPGTDQRRTSRNVPSATS
jgi:EmrB/QacA subfamily drug resistance transporter